MEQEWQLLLAKWQRGERDRDTCLRVAFFVWTSAVDPPFCNDLEKELPVQLATEAFECLGGNLCTDEEVLFVFSVMTAIAAWGLGNEEYWMQVGQDFRRRLNGTVPNPAQFANRSAYGEYFGHQASGR